MWRRLNVLLIFGLFSFCAGADDSLFQKGLAAYQSKQYAEARDDFQKLMESGGATPSLLNNLALSLYQLDQKPMALAFWRKALSMRPGYGPARAGRDLLETKMQMRPFERDSLNLWLHRVLEQLSLYQLLWLNALGLALAGWFGLRYWGERRSAFDEGRELPSFPIAFALSAIVALATLTVLGLKAKDVVNPRATIVTAKASARSLPSEEGVALFDLNGGNEVLVRREQEGWAQVQNSDGATGWVKNTEILVTSAGL